MVEMTIHVSEAIPPLLQLCSQECPSRTKLLCYIQGNYKLQQTLKVSLINGLTIQGNGSSTIQCKQPKTHTDIGSGLVFQSVSNLTIFNLIIQGCGTLQLSTTFRNGTSVPYRSAVYIINSTSIHFSNLTLLKSVGRGLSCEKQKFCKF